MVEVIVSLFISFFIFAFCVAPCASPGDTLAPSLELLLAVLGVLYGTLEIEPELATYKANAIFPVLSLQPFTLRYSQHFEETCTGHSVAFFN